MNIKQFYVDLQEWIKSINEQANKLSPADWWVFIMTSAGQLSDSYDNHSLVKKVILAHIDYLEEVYREQKGCFRDEER